MDLMQQQKNNRQVATWLLIGVGMIVIQVLIGGITRLTESGLSITEWKPITGALPPLTNADWQIEFDKYRNTDQFKYVHQYFSLKEFKFIFFWEWFHRLWARMLSVVFLIGFVYFIIKKKFNRTMILPMVILFFLGAMQGAIGWFMVKSGLVPEKYFVGHIELTTHFIAALILLSYTFWFAISLMPSFKEKIFHSKTRTLLITIISILFIQLIYGGFMAGLKAAATAPTWPSINGAMIPSTMNELSPWIQNLINNKITIHFIHRGIAYTLFALTMVFYFQTKNLINNTVFKKLRISFISLITIQVLLGISTLLTATSGSTFIIIGVAHQFTAMLLVLCLVTLLFVVKKTNKAEAV
jgi:cytochrome c oxidase assembly protein subunit 15